MANTLPLSGNELTTLSGAMEAEDNLLIRLQRPDADEQHCMRLWNRKEQIQKLVAHHLRLEDSSDCAVQPIHTWIMGRFNICILIEVRGAGESSKKIVRCPKEYRFGGQKFPAAVEEKMRVEVGTYVWIEEHCSDVRIPYLFGFGYHNGAQYTHDPSRPTFVQDPYLDQQKLDFSYMVLEYVSDGRVLADAIAQDGINDPGKKRNLLRGLSRAMTSLARESHYSIGSARINDEGSAELTNRPMFCEHSRLEGEGIPRAVTGTYPDSGSFMLDMLHTCERAFRSRPNAAWDEAECRQQMSHLDLLRSKVGKFVPMDYRGPFVLQLTDLNPGNFFVDEAWNLLCIVDLEFINFLPPWMMSEPWWVSVKKIDDIKDNQTYLETHEMFLDLLEREELGFHSPDRPPLAVCVREGLQSGSRWICNALTAHQSIWMFVEHFIYPQLGMHFATREQQDNYDAKASRAFTCNSDKFVRKKLKQKRRYDRKIVDVFAARGTSLTDGDIGHIDVFEPVFQMAVTADASP